jgi:copper(I)-binding protein
MSFKLSLAALAAVLALPAAAEIAVSDAFARSASPTAMTGAAFMQIANTGAEEDRLVAVRSDVAERVELHTHMQDANGVMRMIEVEDGFAIPAGGSHALARGGDHVMFMGLRQPLEQGATVPVVLVFEKAGEIAVEIPVDNARMGAGH